jgi:ribonucleoside-triphosphate reductase
MIVKKQDNTLEEYNPNMIKENIQKVSKIIGDDINENMINSIISNLYVYDNIESKEIRRQVENALMSVNKKIAKAYINEYGAKEEVKRQLKNKSDFIKNYINSSNAATGSKYDANANVSSKNIVTMGQELYKDNNIKQNRWILYDKIRTIYSKKIALEYINDLESHRLYKHDETAIPGMPYCVAITMYPFLFDGLTKLGGQSIAPTDTKSFSGEFINLVYSISSQFAGAVATPEYLMYLDYFIRKDYGNDYITKLSEIADLSVKKRTIEQIIENNFQQVVHSMNMPAGNRGYQTVFWNISYFDKYYFEGIFGDFVFPDGTKPIWETLSWLQRKFMKWFNAERNKYVLTFPVETVAMLSDDNDIIDKEYGDFISEMWSEGHSFFCYLSNSPDSLSSCCRLRNSISVNEDEIHNHTTHQFSMGTASVATGSKSVMTININQIIQDAANRKIIELKQKNLDIASRNGVRDIIHFFKEYNTEIREAILKEIKEITERVHKYQTAFNETIKDFLKAKMLDVYSAGFIDARKQYLTIGINGLTDAAEFLGIEITNNETYKEFVNDILETINKCNAAAKTKELMFNTEFVPGENLSVKNYTWNKSDGYFVSDKHDMYSSYFFNPEDKSLTIIDKMILHGKEYVKYLDGGSACHLNIKEHLKKSQYRQLLKIAVKNGTNYFTFNCKNTVCNDCGYISKDTFNSCPKCNSTNLDYLTRIIGYLKRVSSFSEPRQKEEHIRYYNLMA